VVVVLDDDVDLAVLALVPVAAPRERRGGEGARDQHARQSGADQSLPQIFHGVPLLDELITNGESGDIRLKTPVRVHKQISQKLSISFRDPVEQYEIR
jgi:hypothetical protein